MTVPALLDVAAPAHDAALSISRRAERLGYVQPNDTLGGTASHRRASFCDPVAEAVDPTSLFGPEQSCDWQKPDAPARTWVLPDQGGFGAKHRTWK